MITWQTSNWQNIISVLNCKFEQERTKFIWWSNNSPFQEKWQLTNRQTNQKNKKKEVQNKKRLNSPEQYDWQMNVEKMKWKMLYMLWEGLVACQLYETNLLITVYIQKNKLLFIFNATRGLIGSAFGKNKFKSADKKQHEIPCKLNHNRNFVSN